MSRTLPPLNALRAFEAAARHQSIKRAAEELHVTHGAVSRHVRHLEEMLEVRLFDRLHRRVVLTPAGENLRAVAADAFDRLEGGLRQTRKPGVDESLVVAVEPDLASLWLVPRLADLRRLLPEVKVEITAAKDVVSFPDPRIDCAVHHLYAPSPGFRVDTLFSCILFPVCSPELLKHGPPLSEPADLRHHTLLHDRNTAEWERFLELAGVSDVVDSSKGVIISETALNMDAAVRGQGVAMGDDVLAAEHLARGQLVPLFGPSMRSENSYYLIVPQPRLARRSIRVFRDWLLAAAEQTRAEAPTPPLGEDRAAAS